MKNIVKITLTTVLIASLMLSVCIPSFALTINNSISDNYVYNYEGDAVEAPVAYNPIRVITAGNLGLNQPLDPSDLFVDDEGYLYVVDCANNQILILDDNYEIAYQINELTDSEDYKIPELWAYVVDATGEAHIDDEMAKYSRKRFNNPKGIYVKDGLLYVADTQNRRIVVCDKEGSVKNVIQGINISVISNYIFKPLKVVIDLTGNMEIIAYSVNRGLVEVDEDGNFRGFFGSPPVSYNLDEWFWRLIATDAQKKQLTKYVPTEYSNITMDNRGFIYSTISTIDGFELMSAIFSNSVSGATAPVSKLSPSGSDVLQRLGEFPPAGDLKFDPMDSTQIVDCAVDMVSGRYTILDSNSGRFFTYDPSGEFLYMAGGYGSQYGNFRNASSIVYRGEQIIVGDTSNDSLTVYETTDYAKLINSAVAANTAGEFALAADLWKEVLKYNSNMYIAYVGLGKAEMRVAMSYTSDDPERLEHYQSALDWYELGFEKENYSKAFKQLRTQEISDNFTLIMICFIVLVVGLIVLYYVSKNKKSKKQRRVQ